MNFVPVPISDSHIHIFWNMPLAEREVLLRRLMDRFGYDTVTLLAIPYSTTRLSKCRDFTENLNAFYVKSKMPSRVYAFAGMPPSHDVSKNTPEFLFKKEIPLAAFRSWTTTVTWKQF